MNAAIEPKDKAITGMTYPAIFVPMSAVSPGQRDGNHCNLKAKSNNNKEIMTKEGTEIIIMTRVEMTWSVVLFFFNAAQMPKTKPNGIEKIIDQMLTLIVGRSL